MSNRCIRKREALTLNKRVVLASLVVTGLVAVGCGPHVTALGGHKAHQSKRTPKYSRAKTPTPSGPWNQMYSLTMITPEMGWGFELKQGGNLTLIHTSDGGDRWTNAMPSAAAGNPLFYALDGNTAWLALVPLSADQPIVDYLTDDGGRSWQRGTVLATHVAGGGGGSLYFLNAQDGWMEVSTQGNSPQGLGQGPGVPAPLYATTDGGLNWHLVSSTLPSAGSLVFTSPASGFLATTDAMHPLYVTQDGGVNWKSVVSFPKGLHIVNVPVFDGTNALTWAPTSPLGGTSSSAQTSLDVVSSTDGGSTWASHPTSFSVLAESDVEILNSLTAVAVTKDGTLYVTKDGGKTWTSRPPGSVLATVMSSYSPQQVDFISPSVGWMQLDDGSSTNVWYSTVNGGETWTLKK